MKILFRLSALAALCICASAATHIQSNEYYADGVTPFAGKLYVMGPSGSTTTASTVLPSVTIGAVGLVDVSLIGCAGCTYRVTFQLVNARGTVTQTWQETWVVPDTSATLTRATVVDGANSPSGIINPQRMGSVGLTAGQIWVWDGAKWIAAANAAGGGIVTMVTGAGAPSAACVAPSLSNLQTYTDTTNQDLWACVATNTWKKLLSTTNSGATWEFFAQGTCPAAADVTTAGYDYALCMQYGALNQRASTALGGALTAIGSGGGGAASWTTLTDLQWTTLTN
jgi:hypothetical protein